MKLRVFIYLLIPAEADIKPVNIRSTYAAGEEIQLRFITNTPVNTHIILQGSYGDIVLQPLKEEKDSLMFTIPSFLSQKRGIIQYILVANEIKHYSGTIEILPSTKIQEPLESYLGPPSITAGSKDYGMFVVLPTDRYDNPVKDSTLVTIKHQFLDLQKEDSLYTNNFIAWKNIHSYEASGRILIAAESNHTVSKEFTLDVFPDQSTSFDLYVSKKHAYADGNQMIEFFTSVITDTFGNPISDGRIVVFSILTDTKQQLRTTGTTNGGVARGYMIHPAYKSTWTVQAFIPEMAESNERTLDFKQASEDYNVVFMDSNRNIKVGPIMSFMNQIIPDGALVFLHIYKENKLLETMTKSSHQGMVNFKLSEDFFSTGIYTLELESMGITKKYNRIHIE